MTNVSDPTKVKLRVPDACRSIRVDGATLPIDADGSLQTDATTAAALEAHGAVPWQDEPQPADLAVLSRDALVELFMTRTRAALAAQDTETIRASLADAADDSSPAVTRDDIARMNRAAVLSYLEKRDVDVPAGASLADLRIRAVATLED